MNCKICKKEFISYKGIGLTCSRLCGKKLKRLRDRERYRRNPELSKNYIKKLRESQEYRKKQMVWNNKWATKNIEKRRFIKLKSQNKRYGRILTGDFTFSEWVAIKKFYKFTCAFCGKQEPEIKLTQDHINPISKGGEHTKSNIQPLCGRCNSKKSNKTCYRLITSR